MWCTVWLGLSSKLGQSGLSLALVAMTLQTFVGAAFAPFLPWFNRRFSVVGVWFFFELTQLSVLVSFRWLGPSQPYWVLCLCVFGGLHYLVHSSNSQLLCRFCFEDENERLAFANAVVSNSMPLAQVVVGFFAGLVVGKCPESTCAAVGEYLFFWTGSIGLAFNVILFVVDVSWLKSGLFR